MHSPNDSRAHQCCQTRGYSIIFLAAYPKDVPVGSIQVNTAARITNGDSLANGIPCF